MRIVIDCFKQVKGAGKSMGIYQLTLHLVKNLILWKERCGDAEIRAAELYIIGSEKNQTDFHMNGSHFVCIKNYDPLSKKDCLLWELFAVSMVCRKLKADKIIFTRGYNSVFPSKKDFIIIHDMIPFYYHENYPNFFNVFEK